MSFKNAVKSLIAASGWSVKRTKNLPTSVDWSLDIKRKLPSVKPGVIFDVGANVGQTTMWLRRQFPEANVHAFEPVPTTYASLLQATSGLPRVCCHSIALGDAAGVRTIQTIPNEERNSLVTGIFERHPEAQKVEIRIQTVDAFCQEHGIGQIDVLKTDTEGYDIAVIDGAARMLSGKGIGVIVSEVTFDPGDRLHTSFKELCVRLSDHGFLACGFYETETLFNVSELGSYCNAMFVRRDLIRSGA